jgi:hypothetical protein
LQRELGSGFSVTNLRYMRRFYLSNRIQQTSAELNWSQHVELLPVTNKVDKKRLDQRIVGEKLSPRQIRQEVHQLKLNDQASKQDKPLGGIVLAVLEWGLDHTETRSPQRANAGSWRLGFVVLELGFMGRIGSAGAGIVAFGFILGTL